MPEPAASPGARAPGTASPGTGAPGTRATGPGERPAAGTPSSVEWTTACLQRIAELNPALGAVISVSPDAGDQAAARDQEAVIRRPVIRHSLTPGALCTASLS